MRRPSRLRLTARIAISKTGAEASLLRIAHGSGSPVRATPVPHNPRGTGALNVALRIDVAKTPFGVHFLRNGGPRMSDTRSIWSEHAHTPITALAASPTASTSSPQSKNATIRHGHPSSPS